MTDKQKEAVKFFYNLRATIEESIMLFDEDINVKCGKETIKQITIVLNIIKTQQAEIDSLKDFKEIAESKVTDLNPIGLARTNQLLSRQCHKLQEESEKKDIDIIEAKEANRQLSVELQNKDKIIKELEEKLSERNMEKH